MNQFKLKSQIRLKKLTKCSESSYKAKKWSTIYRYIYIIILIIIKILIREKINHLNYTDILNNLYTN